MDAIRRDLLDFIGKRRFATILADPPWQFINKTGKVAPEHRRLSRYDTMKLDEIVALPVEELATRCRQFHAMINSPVHVRRLDVPEAVPFPLQF